MKAVERSNRFLVGAAAHVVEDTKEVAWAEKLVRQDRDLKWILGNFVEADNFNSNGHFFPLSDLQSSFKSILNKPLNMLHQGEYIVGSYVGAELVYPEHAEHQAADEAPAGGNPIIEALSGFWRHQFPEEFQVVEKAHKKGALYYSMEAIPETLNCAIDGCPLKEKAVAYAGRQSDTYCDHINKTGGGKILNKPHFGAGALIIPPAKPGWKRADINELSELLNHHADEAEAIYANLEAEFPHLEPSDWEGMMNMVMLQARQDKYGAAGRRKLAKEGKALPGGEFPIADKSDLKNAIQNIGRASNPSVAKKHIIKRARALGLTELIPEHWQQ